MAATHLQKNCTAIPSADREQLSMARQQTFNKGSKEYWIDCCNDMGIVEDILETTTGNVGSSGNNSKKEDGDDNMMTQKIGAAGGDDVTRSPTPPTSVNGYLRFVHEREIYRVRSADSQFGQGQHIRSSY